MEIKNPNALYSSKIHLGVLEEEDLKKIFKWKNDCELSKLIKAHPLPNAKFEVEEWLKKNQSDKNHIIFGIRSTESNELVGIIRLMFIDWISSVAEAGIFIGDPENRDRGYGKEAMKIMLNFAFRDLNLHKVNLKVLESNKIAIKLYESLGFVTEGILRSNFWVEGKYEDIIVMGILKDEWKR